jgi:PAS domain S-box-containing protein
MLKPHRTILIVDDFPADRELYRRYLLDDVEFSYQILEAESASDALDLSQTEDIDGILLDFLLPDLDGLEFLAELKTQKNVNCPPVIIITGQGSTAIAVKAIKSGAEDYLVKEEIKPEDLQQAVSCAIEKVYLRRELQASEERFRISVENMLDCFGICSSIRDDLGNIIDFRIDYLNPAAMESNRMMGEDIGKKLCELFPVHHESGLFYSYCQVVETGQPLAKESLIYTDVFGTEVLTRAYDIRVSKLSDGIVISWRDITNKKQTEIALQESERKLRAIFNSTFQFIGLLNTDGILLEANQAALDFAEIQEEDVVNRPFWETKWWTIDHETQEQLKQAIACASSGSFVRYEVDVLGANNSVITIDFSLQPVRDENGHVVLIIPEGRDISYQKTVLAQLQSSQNFIQRIAETSPGILYVYDLIEQRNVYVNRQITEVLGYTKAQVEAMGTNLLSTLLHPDDFANTPAHLELLNSAKDGDVVEREYRMQHTSGEWRWFLGRETVFSRNADGKPSQILGIAQDITSSKRTQAELFSAVEKFEFAAAAVNCLIYDWDVEKGTVDRTEGLTRLVGYTLEEADPSVKWWGEQIHPEDWQKMIHEGLDAALASTERSAIEYRVRHKDGHYIWVEDRSIIIHSPDGKPIRMVGSTTDITERKRLELELRDSETLLNLAMSSAQMGFWDLNFQTRNANWSVKSKELLGLPPDWSEENFANFINCVHPDDREFINQTLLRAAESGDKYEAEYRVVWSDGSIHWLADKGEVFYEETGQPVRAIGMVAEITEKKQAQEEIKRLYEELQRRVGELQTVFDIMPVGIAIAEDPRCEVIRANTFAENLLNVPHYTKVSATAPEAERLPYKQLRDGKEISGEDLPMQFSAKHGVEIRNSEIQIVRADGVILDLWVNSKPLFDEQEKVRGCIAAFMDITERKQTELALQREREKLDFVLNNAKASIIRFWVFANQDWKYDYYSSGCEAIFGYTCEELIANKNLWMSRVLPEDLENVIYPKFQDIFAELTVSYEYRFNHKDGSLRWIADTLTSRFDATENAWIVTAIGIDITERKLAEAALQESEALFRGIFDSDLIGILLWNSQGQVTNANNAFIKMTGYTRSEMQAGEIYYKNITPPEYHESDAQKIQILYENGEYQPFEKEYLCKDGSRIPILIGCAFLPGYKDRGVAFCLDITEKKRSEQERERLLAETQAAREEAVIANQTKDEFLAVVSHELRSPLNSILGWAKLLQTRPFEQATAKRALETIERNAKSQSQLIEDLLDISRMIKGNLRLELAPVNLTDVIQASIEMISPTALTKQINIEFLQKNELNLDFTVSGDFGRLQQVVVNLLTNAVKFTPNEGQVKIELSHSKTPTPEYSYSAIIKVQDTGKGIPPDFLPYVFERFRQARNSSRAKEGLGLGLAIVRNLVELHDGTITAASPGKDQGATFTVILPLIGNGE